MGHRTFAAVTFFESTLAAVGRSLDRVCESVAALFHKLTDGYWVRSRTRAAKEWMGGAADAAAQGARRVSEKVKDQLQEQESGPKRTPWLHMTAAALATGAVVWAILHFTRPDTGADLSPAFTESLVKARKAAENTGMGTPAAMKSVEAVKPVESPKPTGK